MEETSMDYSLLKIGRGENKSDPVRPVRDNNRISMQKSTLYIVVICLSVIIVGSEIFIYLMSSRNNNCNVVIPEGYSVLARKSSSRHISSGNTLPQTTAESTTLVTKLTTNQTRQEWTKAEGVTTVATKQTTENLGCPDNWLTYGQSCYYFSNQSVTWLDAMARCQTLGGYLAEINTASENQFLRTHAKQINSKECFPSTLIKYEGLQTTTYEGHVCQRWDSQKPHSHSRNNIRKFPETRLADAANYCRDPDEEGIPWCYTTDPDIRWQYCDIYKCPGGNWWIGMVILERKWKWMSTQTELDKGYTNWGDNEPSKGNCGSFMGALDFAWNGENCNFPAMYLCEK
ncbi:asialoglycoprotein receptor 1-like [Mercenaria mercenaria]|uniref:asialoglycoprotein receptor 1-like n=1 Tax=Mercenaria mercenaria TaxID=6596 RepID=UPI00234E88EB|nr:asialoglycoprotein receptor 1-like [Mercenaria mercenaria]